MKVRIKKAAGKPYGVELVASSVEDREIIKRFWNGGVKINSMTNDTAIEFTFADLIETGDNPQCCICGYEIKINAETDKELTRQDTKSFQTHEKWVCGTCGDEIRSRE